MSSGFSDEDHKSSGGGVSPSEESRKHYKHRSRRSPDRGNQSRYDKKRPRVKMPGLDGPLMSYKTFVEIQREPLSSEEVQRYYD